MLIVALLPPYPWQMHEDYSKVIERLAVTVVFVVIIESKVRLESLLNASLLLTSSLARFLPLSEVPGSIFFVLLTRTTPLRSN